MAAKEGIARAAAPTTEEAASNEVEMRPPYFFSCVGADAPVAGCDARNPDWGTIDCSKTGEAPISSRSSR